MCYMCVYVYVSMYICVCVYVCVHVHVCVHVCVCTCVHVCVCVCVYVCMCVHHACVCEVGREVGEGERRLRAVCRHDRKLHHHLPGWEVDRENLNLSTVIYNEQTVSFIDLKANVKA